MKRMLSGIKPTGQLTLGNYIGALSQFVSYQDECEMIAFIANLHCITVYQDPKDLRFVIQSEPNSKGLEGTSKYVILEPTSAKGVF